MFLSVYKTITVLNVRSDFSDETDLNIDFFGRIRNSHHIRFFRKHEAKTTTNTNTKTNEYWKQKRKFQN